MGDGDEDKEEGATGPPGVTSASVNRCATSVADTYDGPTMGPAGEDRTDKARRRRALQAEMAEGFGAPPTPAALNLSHVGMRHERRQVRARMGWDASTVICGRPTNSSFEGSSGERHGTLNRVASWCEGTDRRDRHEVRKK